MSPTYSIVRFRRVWESAADLGLVDGLDGAQYRRAAAAYAAADYPPDVLTWLADWSRADSVSPVAYRPPPCQGCG
jgi:hypothetical protein